MNKLQLNQNKTLRLTNVLKYNLDLTDESFNLQLQVEKMQSYIKTKGALQIGPLIQYTRTYLNDNGEIDMDVVLMLQCNNYIHNVETPYTMDSLIRITDCMYCRYIGPEDKLKFAYDKINLDAFESDIVLIGSNYTIFVSNNEEDETIIADVFMEREKVV